MMERGTGIDRAGYPRSRRVLILLPTLNEAEGLRKTIAELPLDHLRSRGYSPTVLVVDGHSTDGTIELARREGAVVLVQNGSGKGGAIREGIDWARSREFDYVAVLDADFTYPATGVSPLVALLDAGSDLVIGVRRPSVAPLRSARQLVHRLGGGMLNYLAAQLSRSPVLDVCCGLWGIRVASFAEIPLISDGFEIEAELFLKALRHGLKVSQIPTLYRERVGTAKLTAARDGAAIALAIIRHARRAPSRRRHVGPADSEPAVPGGLERILLAMDARELIVYTHPDRAMEAQLLADSLRTAQMRVRVHVDDFETWTQREFGFPVGGDPSVPPDRLPIMVTLPDRSGGAGPLAVVGIPRTQRLVCLGGLPGGVSSLPSPDRSGGYRLERSFGSRVGTFTVLSSAIDPSPRIRELALIGANGSAAPLDVYERVPNGGALGLPTRE